MKKMTYLLFAILFLVACNKDEEIIEEDKEIDFSVPECILEMIENESWTFDVYSVSVQTQEEEQHYLIDFYAFDIDRPIFDGNCEEVCYYGGWVTNPTACEDDYDRSGWEVIWEQ